MVHLLKMRADDCDVMFFDYNTKEGTISYYEIDALGHRITEPREYPVVFVNAARDVQIGAHEMPLLSFQYITSTLTAT